MKRCDSCKYWRKVRWFRVDYGMCHRYPRQIEVSGLHWCAEYCASELETDAESGDGASNDAIIIFCPICQKELGIDPAVFPPHPDRPGCSCPSRSWALGELG